MSASVLLNDGPFGMGQDRNLGWKLRLNFSQKGKAGKWEAVRSHGPPFRRTPLALAGMAQRVGCCPTKQKVTGSIPVKAHA